MDAHAPVRVASLLGAGVTVTVALVGFAMLAAGLLSEGNEILAVERQYLEAAFDHLDFARAFAYGDVLQAAGDALAKRR